MQEEGKIHLSGAYLIAEERRRQVEILGFTTEQDIANHPMGEMARAAACLCVDTPLYVTGPHVESTLYKRGTIEPLWPWAEREDIKKGKGRGDCTALQLAGEPSGPETRLRKLVIAGALIAAQIDLELSIGASRREG